ncbi:MAG: type II toxin-antitoxin system RelE/ParE family toxin [Bacteroidetes bacterium]|nr:type II toxin-antitoxin system RelE/ParE family toxin [Bacteroidota bacterium]MBS1943825.1 type II toxin-antitoxin system RelE/ParE family toxin [Bacteroidota bacterium]
MSAHVLVVRDEAQEETEQIKAWYGSQRVGLDDRFVAALEKTYKGLLEAPFYQVRKNVFRYVLVEGFPHYRVVFVVDGDVITVYQVRHTSRKPSKRFGP